MKIMTQGLLLTIILCSSASRINARSHPSVQADAKKKEPIPEAAKLKEAEKAIRDLYKTEYTKKSPADRQALAQTLLQLAQQSQADATTQYVLLKEAQDVATAAADLEIALRSAELILRLFEVERIPYLLAALGALAKTVKSAEDFTRLSERYLAIADEAVAADDYDEGEKANLAASQASRKASDAGLASRIAAKTKELSDARSKFEKVKKAKETLARTPDDPAASLEMGQYLCFAKGAWDLGLPLLAKGADVSIRALAAKDLENPQTAADQLLVGDLWWDLAEKEKSDRKDRMLDRVQFWYEKALPGSVGIARAKIDKRLGSMPPSRRPIDLLPLVDLSKDVVHGTWTAKGSGYVSDDAEFARLDIPYHPSAEYDLRVTFSRLSGNGDEVFLLTQAGRSFGWVVSDSGFLTLKGRWHDSGNPTNVPAAGAIKSGDVQTYLFEVRKDRIRILLDGKLQKELKINYDDTGLPDFLRSRDPAALGLASYKTPTVFLRAEITEVAGRGRRIR